MIKGSSSNEESEGRFGRGANGSPIRVGKGGQIGIRGLFTLRPRGLWDGGGFGGEEELLTKSSNYNIKGLLKTLKGKECHRRKQKSR
jgi:hypothetical protein